MNKTNRRSNRRRQSNPGAMLLAVVTMVVLGAGIYGSVWSQHLPQADYQVGYDPTSDYTPNLKEVAATVIAELRRTDKDTYALRAVDHTTTLISTDFPTSTDEAYTQLSAIPSVRVTDMGQFFSLMADVIASHFHDAPSSTPIVLIVFTDGLSDQAAKAMETQIQAAGAKLAKRPRCSILLVGGQRETRPGHKGLYEMLTDNGRSELHVEQIPATGLTADKVLGAINRLRH